MVDNINVMENV